MDKSPAPVDSAEERRVPWSLVLVGITMLYAAAHLSWYSATPLGLHPVLDGKEMLHLAEDITNETLPAEPFYRAPLYAAIIAGFMKAGVPPNLVPITAQWFNGACHVASALLVFAIAHRIWRREKAAFLAGLLYGINPVALHFAGDPLDITLAVMLLLAGLYFAVRALNAETPWRDGALAGFFWGFGALARPHLLPVALAWPILVLVTTRKWKLSVAALAGPVLLLLLMGLVNLGLSGRFTILPAQGAYNLYAANRPGAHGKYLTQTMELESVDDADANPARVESEILYLRETLPKTPVDLHEMNRFWRRKAFKRIAGEPLSWTGQMLRKVYYLLNNYEQYNNKTYFLHKARSPLLRFNPLNWSWLLLLGTGGLMLGFSRREARHVSFIALIYAAGVLLFFVSARFRLPLVPLLAILSGAWLSDIPKRFTPRMVIPPLLVVVSLTAFAGARDKRTLVEDYILMSRASLDCGFDEEAQEHAFTAIALDSSRLSAHKLLALSRYNLLVAGLPSLPPQEELEVDLARARKLRNYSDDMAYLEGVYLWQLGGREKAVKIWQSLVDRGSRQGERALAALLLTGSMRESDRGRLRAMPIAERSDFLLTAEYAAGHEDVKEELSRRMPADFATAQAERLRQLFEP